MYYQTEVTFVFKHRSIIKQCEVGKLTEVVVEVSKAIRHVVYPQGVGIKDSPAVTAGFVRMGFPNCAGAIQYWASFALLKEHLCTYTAKGTIPLLCRHQWTKEADLGISVWAAQEKFTCLSFFASRESTFMDNLGH